ncbi:hypothetical protein NP493_7398g00000 [Ridgeia piscesae]|uniref:Uncharacterized protein n=1 Tax=Ridgeia piscesae TaxID=27915 RepID=A0AAD9IRB8_RIDPI|nr:hypothetical protein NP493_7398g00000 [Ridgeia piscesae]
MYGRVVNRTSPAGRAPLTFGRFSFGGAQPGVWDGGGKFPPDCTTRTATRKNAQGCILPAEEKQIAFTSVSLGSDQTESNLSEVCSDFYFRSKSLAQFNDIQVEPLKPNSMDRTDTQTSSLLDSALAVEL